MDIVSLLPAGGLTGFDGSLVSTSLVLVFALLIVLCLIITLQGKIFDSFKKKQGDEARAELDRARACPGGRPGPGPPRAPAAPPPPPRWRPASPARWWRPSPPRSTAWKAAASRCAASAACRSPAHPAAASGVTPAWRRTPSRLCIKPVQPGFRLLFLRDAAGRSAAGGRPGPGKGGAPVWRPF